MLQVKQGDTLPALTIPTGVDLSAATAVRVVGVRAGLRIIDRDLDDGVTKAGQIITMAWQTADTSLPGLIAFEAIATLPGGEQTFGPVYAQVVADLASAGFVPAEGLVPVPDNPGFFMIGGTQ